MTRWIPALSPARGSGTSAAGRIRPVIAAVASGMQRAAYQARASFDCLPAQGRS